MTTLVETLIQGGLIKRLELPKYFYQGLFPKQFLSKTDKIIFDEVYEDFRGIAKFVAPNVVSRVNQTKTFDVKAFRPAYAKEKDAIEAWDDGLMQRFAGEEIGGTYSPAQRAKMIRAKQLLEHRTKMENLYEWMAFKAFANAELTITGEDYPTTVISYFRDPVLTVSSLGGAAWNATNANPLDTIGQMSDLVYDKSQGNVDTVIMGRSAYKSFYNYMSHKDRRDLFDRNTRGSDVDMNLIWAGEVKGVSMVATFTASNGQTVEIYVDNRVYVDANGDAIRYVGENEVIGFDSIEFKGVMAFGAIKDKKAGYQVTRMFHKEFENEEPSVDYLLTQSAPLPINLTPNHVFRIVNVNA